MTTAACSFASGQTAANEARLRFHNTRPPIKQTTAMTQIAITLIMTELRPTSAVVVACDFGAPDTPGDDRTGSDTVKVCTPDTPGTLPRANEVTTKEPKSAGIALDSEDVTALGNICGSLDTKKPAVMAATADEKFTLVLIATNGPGST